MLSTIKLVKKIHLQNFGPLAHGTGPKHGLKMVKIKKIFKFRRNLFLWSLEYAEYEKDYEKNPSLKFWPVGPFDWPET